MALVGGTREPTHLIDVVIEGTAPILFSKCPPTITDTRVLENYEKEPQRRLYRNPDNTIYLPDENLYSFLAAQQTPSCVKRWGPQGRFQAEERKEMCENILAFVKIRPSRIPFLRGHKQIRWEGFDDIEQFDWESGKGNFCLYRQPGRVQKGKLIIPQHSTRVLLGMPWLVAFKVKLLPNPKHISPDMLYGWFVLGGPSIGLCSFRPRFGSFKVTKWNVVKEK